MHLPEMRTAKAISLGSLPLIGVLCLFGCARESAVPPAPASENPNHGVTDQLPEWSLAESNSASLGAPFKMSQFEIRPPANFRFIKYLAESKTYYWVGPVRKDETYAQLMVTITALSDDEANASLKSMLDNVVGSIQKRRENWTDTPAEHGTINGLPFVRSSWSGVATGVAREGLSGRMMHGVVYLTVRDKQAISIMCQDVAPDHVESIKLGGWTALTFRAAPTQKSSP
jgi:hypothetical protein